MNGKFVALEGVDNVGKTTLSKCIVRKVGGNAVYLKTPVEPFFTRCKSFDLRHNSRSLEKRFELFVEGMKYSSAVIEEYKEEGKIVVADRWIWTTFAYHFAKDNDLYAKLKNRWQQIEMSLVKPDANYFIVVSDKELANRYIQKELSVGDIQLIKNVSLRKRIIDFFLTLNPTFEIIDNSDTVKDSMNTIFNSLTRHAIV